MGNVRFIMWDQIRNIISDDTGATAVEYGLITMLICVAIIGAITNVGNGTNNLFNAVYEKIVLYTAQASQ